MKSGNHLFLKKVDKKLRTTRRVLLYQVLLIFSFLLDEASAIVCWVGCATCTSAGQYSCTSCLAGYTLIWGQKCVANCPYDQCFGGSDTCSASHAWCTTCTTPNNQHTCGSCAAQYYLDQTSCRPKCPKNYFLYSGTDTCTACHSSCINSCTTNVASACCTESQYLIYLASTGVCANCHPSCKTCNGGDGNSCLSCPNKSGEMFPSRSCLGSEYEYDDGSACQTCDPSCLSCDGKYKQNCIACKNGSPPNSDGTCSGNCPYGTFYESVGSTCASCTANCEVCTGTLASDCKKCYPGYDLGSSGCVLPGGVSVTCPATRPILFNGVCYSDLPTRVTFDIKRSILSIYFKQNIISLPAIPLNQILNVQLFDYNAVALPNSAWNINSFQLVNDGRKLTISLALLGDLQLLDCRIDITQVGPDPIFRTDPSNPTPCLLSLVALTHL